jgi:hypothetical protein
MQQRQLRLGDILDDYCPRERRLTNHAVVAMVGPDVKQTRCTTCDAEHDYKHAKVPRQRKKPDSAAVLYAQVLAGGPKKVTYEAPGAAVSPSEPGTSDDHDDTIDGVPESPDDRPAVSEPAPLSAGEEDSERESGEEGPVHRPLIRAQLPRIEGQPPPARQAPDFTIRQPTAARTNRFRPRHQRGAPGGGQFQGQGNNRFNNAGGNTAGGGPGRGGSQRHGGGRPPVASRVAKRHGPGRKGPK